MEIISQKINKNLLIFAVFEFAIVFASVVFTWMYIIDSLSRQGSIVWYGVLFMIISVGMIIKGILLNRAEKKLTGKRNLTLSIVNTISILLVLFIVIMYVVNFIILILLLSSFSGQ